MSLQFNYKSFFKETDDAKRQYWGNPGAGCIFISKDTGRILLALRSGEVEEPGTWGTWGGKINLDETPKQAVEREVEETGFSGDYKLSLLYIYRDGSVSYHNYVVIVPFEFKPKLNWESDSSKWFEFGKWPENLHFGMEDLLANAGSKIGKIVSLIKDKIKKYKIGEDIDAPSPPPPPSIVKSSTTFSPKFIEYIKSVENAGKIGYKQGKWYPHKSPEGGNPTIGYGHKIKNDELKRFMGGISDSEAERLLRHDLEDAKARVYSDIKHMFKVQIPLAPYQEEMLIDYAFNLGTIRGFPSFTRAVLNKDWKKAAKECIRTYKDSSGKRHILGRNKAFINTFLKPLLSGSTSKISKK